MKRKRWGPRRQKQTVLCTHPTLNFTVQALNIEKYLFTSYNKGRLVSQAHYQLTFCAHGSQSLLLRPTAGGSQRRYCRPGSMYPWKEMMRSASFPETILQCNPEKNIGHIPTEEACKRPNQYTSTLSRSWKTSLRNYCDPEKPVRYMKIDCQRDLEAENVIRKNWESSNPGTMCS